MSEIERYEPDQPAKVAPITGAELDVIMRQADMLAASDIIPKDYRRKPANIVVAAMTGRTFGWDAITAMRNGHVIEGTWSIKPEAMLALVRRAGHSVTGEATPEGATVHGKRGDTADEMTVAFTLVDAGRAGLAGKNVWKQYPQSMCWARAVSQLCRQLFADVTLGLSYTPEELGAAVDADGAVIDVNEALPPPPKDPVPGLRTSIQAAIDGLDEERQALQTERFDAAGLPPEATDMDADQCDRAMEILMRLDVEVSEADPERARGVLVDAADSGPKKVRALNAARKAAERDDIALPLSFDDITEPALVDAALSALGVP